VGSLLREVLKTSGLQALAIALRYMFEVAPEEERQALPEAIRAELPTEAEEAVPTIADALRHEGRQEGRQEGRRLTIMEQMEAKFGALSDADRRRIETAPIEQLIRWQLRLLSAGTASEVFVDVQ
jgi:hypothetical protein